MAVSERTASQQVVAGRERYVARGVATTPLVVGRAEGARLWDVDGREYIDFAGGLGCQNTGHGFAAAAIHEQVDRYLHQCFMVGIYEPYVEVCRLLDELWPGATETRSVLVNSGAEAVENAVKIARVATGRPAVIAFDHAFHGRTNLTMALTAKAVPYKDGFGPFAPEVYRADTTIESLEHVFKQDVHPARVAWAIEHYDVEPDLLVSGKSLGGGLPLAAVTGTAKLMNAVSPGGLGGTFGGNPLACAAAIAVLNEVRTPSFRARAEELGRRVRARLAALNAGEVRGLGPMLAVELPEKTPEKAARITAAARERGLVLLSAGLYGNVIRILVPLSIEDELLERGLDLLEEAFGDADAA
jgi:4-aminobutyrate aminotransferase / (S)-3-amino-2-methylpropionate transaminase / 5-aminovalerate transaminase